MALLAKQTNSPSPAPVADQDDAEKTERQVWGAAVRALRLRSGATLHEAASAYEPDGFVAGDPNKGLSVQRWQQIEKGGLTFKPDQRRRLAKALGAAPEELDLERARILGHRVPSRNDGTSRATPLAALLIPIWGHAEIGERGWTVARSEQTTGTLALSELAGAHIGAVRVVDDTLTGWAEAGELVIFDRSRRPTPGQGCVIETKSGELHVRRFIALTATALVVEPATTFARAEVKGVYAVRFRGV
jgi:helix-turn-helix protein